jgi:UDP-N-acetylmuramate dehydrogenase
MHIQENVPLAPLTTFQVGSPARYFVEATAVDDVVDAVDYAASNNIRLFVLGGGSNLLVADSGWPGLVLKIAIKGIHSSELADKQLYEVGAGEDWDAFVARTVQENCAGIETLSGIPGTVGGTPVQNVGAYGQEVSETIISVKVLDIRSLHTRDLTASQCGFGYRTSIFNTTERGRYIVLRVSFALRPGGEPNMTYADIQKFFPNGNANLAQVRGAVRTVRSSKGMLIVPGDEDCRSAGSFFKNPIVTLEQQAKLDAIAAKEEKKVPAYPAKEGHVKLSAAWLVENSGFPKGYALGAAGISTKHSLALVNRGGAKAADIVALKDQVQRGAKEKFGIELQPEPVLVGF